MAIGTVGNVGAFGVPVSRVALPEGDAGVDVTVGKMAQVSMGVYGAKSPQVRALAQNIVVKAGVREKDYYGEMVAIHNWVRDTIRYQRDPIGQETLLTPEYLISRSPGSFAGDCDDKSMLEAALLSSIGIPTRFVVVGLTLGNYSHVYLQANVGNAWVSLDPIMPEHDAGWEVPNPARKKIYPENTAEGFGMSGLRGLGYVGDPRVFSFLDSVTPPPEEGPNIVSMAAQQGPGSADNSDLEELAAFPPNQNLPYETPAYAAQDIAVEGMGMLDDGSRRRPRANMNRGVLAGAAEGVDSIFNTPVQIFKGIPRLNYGPRSLAGRTPGRAVTVAGLGRLGDDNTVSTAPASAPAAPAPVVATTKTLSPALIGGAVLLLLYFGFKKH